MPTATRPLPRTDVELDAVVLLRGNARGVAREDALLAVDAPVLTVEQLRASMVRLSSSVWSTHWDAERQLFRCAGGLRYFLGSIHDPRWRDALALAWWHGNAWRGVRRRFGSRPVAMPEWELRVWTYRWQRHDALDWWPPTEDASGPAPSD